MFRCWYSAFTFHLYRRARLLPFNLLLTIAQSGKHSIRTPSGAERRYGDTCSASLHVSPCIFEQATQEIVDSFNYIFTMTKDSMKETMSTNLNNQPPILYHILWIFCSQSCCVLIMGNEPKANCWKVKKRRKNRSRCSWARPSIIINATKTINEYDRKYPACILDKRSYMHG